MTDSKVDAVRAELNAILPELKIEELSIGEVKFDFYSESYDVVFRWRDHATRLRLSSERVAELRQRGAFTLKHLRKELEAALHVDEEEDQ